MREISVFYQDGMMDMIAPEALQPLIDRNEIVKFQRSDGWVYPGIDPIRSSLPHDYCGQERRFE